ncbi:MAG TPA: hypothetical protein VGP36_20635 [Mycobacteriales bacterium]|jgi:hypothetical protein|nr:hypothetical protein [Mycobacteriales bacterium]
MGEVRPIPRLGGVVQDVRGAGRALRVSWHNDDGLVVLSLWDGPRCTGTVRIAAAEVPTLIEALRVGLRPPVLRPPAAPPPPPTEADLREIWGPPSSGLDILAGPDSATG